MAIKFVLKQNLPKNSAAKDQTVGEHIFEGNMFTVGSDAANNLVLNETAAEQIVVIRDGVSLTLINRADGTQVNGQKLNRESMFALTNGDEIGIGNYVISVIDSAKAAANRAENQTIPVIAKTANGTTQNQLPTVTEVKSETEKSSKNLQPTRNFADILDTMRTEEDSFYFIFKDEKGENGRIPLEQPEMPIGANGKGKIAFSIEQISTLFAVARKDWSGILLESQKRNSVYVNDEAIETTRRLRNDDRISFAAPVNCTLILHEPSSLVALESMLSPTTNSNGARFGSLAANNAETAENAIAAKNQNVSPLERLYFGYFSFFEIVTMIIGTLIGAVLFFLLFEFMFS